MGHKDTLIVRPKVWVLVALFLASFVIVGIVECGCAWLSWQIIYEWRN